MRGASSSAELGSRPSSTATRVLAAASMIAILLPFAAVVIIRWGSDYLPIQDLAVLDLRLRDVFGPETPLVGVYSQFGWNHPGPAVYWMLTPFLLVSGGAPWGMLLGSAVMHLVPLAAGLLLVRRSVGALWTIGWAAIIAASYAATGTWMVLEAWNPHLAFPMFTLLLVLAWRCAAAPGSYFPWVVVITSMLVQIHIGYAVLAGAIALWAAVLMVRSFRDGSNVVDRGPTVRWSLVAAGVIWFPPLLEAALNKGGNLRALVAYFVLGRGEESRAGVGTALELIAAQFRWLPPWLGGEGDLDPFTGLAAGASLWWLLLVGVLLAIGLVLWRWCDTEGRRLLELSWVLLVAGAVSLALLRGKVAPYLFYWRIQLALLLVAAVAAGVLRVSGLARIPSVRLAVGALLAAFVITTSASYAIDLWRAPEPIMRFEPATRELLAQVDGVDQPTTIRWAGSPLGGVQAGVVDELARRGQPVAVPVQEGFKWGQQRVAPAGGMSEVWYVAEQGHVAALLKALPGARVVAELSPLDPDDEARLAELQVTAALAAVEAGHPEIIPKLDSPLSAFDVAENRLLAPDEVREFESLLDRAAGSATCRCAIVAVPADDDRNYESTDLSALVQSVRGAL